MKITSVRAIEILDSRGNPTVQAFLTLEDGSVHSAAVPSGASTGKHEAVELRDGDSSRYNGKGVLQAVENVNHTLNDVLSGVGVRSPEDIDAKMIDADGTENKEKLGANAMLAVSMAANRAAAYVTRQPLWQFIHDHYMQTATAGFPGLFANVINGGKHAGWNFDIQEFIVVTKKDTVAESVRTAAEIFHALGKHLSAKGFETLVGDEGGYSPALSSNDEAFQTIIDAGDTTPHVYLQDYWMAIDAAASEFFEDGQYQMKKDNRSISADELLDTYMSYVDRFSLFSMEDPFHEDDWDNFRKITEATSAHTPPCAIVGDDFLVTNPKRIAQAVEQNAASAGLIKVNQIGTISETIKAITLCQQANWKVVISHRSGETCDSFIADLAVGVGADYIKTGSMSRSERLAKYNRLIEIEQREW
jgi:enolase